MGHEVEYDDSMMKMMELIWGDGFMAPGGTENVDSMVNGVDIRGRRVLPNHERQTNLRHAIQQLSPPVRRLPIGETVDALATRDRV